MPVAYPATGSPEQTRRTGNFTRKSQHKDAKHRREDLSSRLCASALNFFFSSM
jgi:hypothetical protein